MHEVYKGGRSLSACDACGFVYEERTWAERCQDYCTKHGACSVEITSHAFQTKAHEIKER